MRPQAPFRAPPKPAGTDLELDRGGACGPRRELIGEASDDVEAIGAAVEGETRLVRQRSGGLVHLGGRDIRQVGHDHVRTGQGPTGGVQEVAARQVDDSFDAVGGQVFGGELEGIG